MDEPYEADDRRHIYMRAEPQDSVAAASQVAAALGACWDEYNELMPDALREQVKAALELREFVADAANE